MSPASSPRSERAAAAAGFTLIEVLVVLVIVAIISATVLAAFERVLDVRLRLVTFLDGTGSPQLVAGWFRDSITGVVGDRDSGKDKFSGAAKRLSALSLTPLSGMPGVPRRISWEIAYDSKQDRSSLVYQADGQESQAVASWPGDHGGLRYCDGDLSCYDSWPPPAGKGIVSSYPQLPALVRLDLVKGTEAWPILAAPRAQRNPAPVSHGLRAQ